MGNPIFLAQDLSLYSLSATSSDASYPLINLKTYLARDKWKSAVLTSPQNLVIDFTIARVCDAIVLQNHNFNSIGLGSGDSLALQYADDPGFSAGAGNAKIWSNGETITDPVYVTFTSQTKRYWRLRFTKSGGLTGYPALGNLFLGLKLDFGTPYNMPARVNRDGYKTSLFTAIEGTIRSTQTFGSRRNWGFGFKAGNAMNSTVRSNLTTFIQTVRGMLRPFYLIDIDDSINYVHMMNDIDEGTISHPSLHEIDIVLATQLTF